MEYIELETGSIIRYIKDLTNNKLQYLYHKIPEDFTKPSIYFPTPEFRTILSSTSSYILNYMWLIKIFAPTTEKAYEIARNINFVISNNRFLIPIINMDGSKSNKAFTVTNIAISKADEGVYTLQIDWNSVRYYTENEVQKMRKHFESYKFK